MSQRSLVRNPSSSSRTSSSTGGAGSARGGGGPAAASRTSSSSHHHQQQQQQQQPQLESSFVAYQQPKSRSLTALAITEGKMRYVDKSKKPAPPRERRLVPRSNVLSPGILLPGKLNAAAPEFRLTPGVVPPLQAQSRHLIASHRVEDKVVEEQLHALAEKEKRNNNNKKKNNNNNSDNTQTSSRGSQPQQQQRKPPPLLLLGSLSPSGSCGSQHQQHHHHHHGSPNRETTPALILPPIEKQQQHSSSRHIAPSSRVKKLDEEALATQDSNNNNNLTSSSSPRSARGAASPSKQQQQHGAIEDRALSLMRFSLLSDLVGAPVGVSMAGQTLNPAIGFDTTGADDVFSGGDDDDDDDTGGGGLASESLLNKNRKPRCVAALFSLRKGKTPGSHIIEWDGGTCRGVLGSNATTSKQSRKFVVAAVRLPTEAEEEEARRRNGSSPQSPFSSFRRRSSMSPRHPGGSPQQQQQQHDAAAFGCVTHEVQVEKQQQQEESNNNNNKKRKQRHQGRDGPDVDIDVMMIATTELNLDGSVQERRRSPHGGGGGGSSRARSTSPGPTNSSSSSPNRFPSFRLASPSSRGTSPAASLGASGDEHNNLHRRPGSGGSGSGAHEEQQPDNNIGAEWEVIQIMYPKRGTSHEVSASLIGAPLHTIQYAPRVALRNVKFPNRILVAEMNQEKQQQQHPQDQQQHQQQQQEDQHEVRSEGSHRQQQQHDHHRDHHHHHHRHQQQQQVPSIDFTLRTRHVSDPAFHGANHKRGEAELLSMFTFVVDSRFVDQFQRSLKKAYTDQETAAGVRPASKRRHRRRQSRLRKKMMMLGSPTAKSSRGFDDDYDEDDDDDMVERPAGHASLILGMPAKSKFQGPGPDCSGISFTNRGVVITMDPCLPPSTVLYRITETFLDEHAERDVAEQIQEHHLHHQNPSSEQQREELALLLGDSESVALTSTLGCHQSWRFYNDDPSLTMVVTASFRGYQDTAISATATASLVGLPSGGAAASSPSSGQHANHSSPSKSQQHSPSTRRHSHASSARHRHPGVSASAAAAAAAASGSGAPSPNHHRGDEVHNVSINNGETHSEGTMNTSIASPGRRRAAEKEKQQQQQQHTVTELEITRKVPPGATVHFFRGFVVGEVAFAFDAF